MVSQRYEDVLVTVIAAPNLSLPPPTRHSRRVTVIPAG